MRPSLLLAMLLALAPLLACRTEAERQVLLYTPEVVAPAQVAPGATLHLTVTAQSGGCLHFDRIDVERTSSRVTLRAMGYDASGPSVVCTDDIRYNVVAVDVAPPFTDPLTVVAEQPDGTLVTRTVAVR